MAQYGNCSACGYAHDEMNPVFCKKCGSKQEAQPIAPVFSGANASMPMAPRSTTHYKTIGGPIELTAHYGEDYRTAVQRYAAIIDAETVGGWELHCIQQIPVKKWKRMSILIGAILGLIIGVVLILALPFLAYDTGPIYPMMGAFIGMILGCLKVHYVIEFFNMLVFVKHD